MIIRNTYMDELQGNPFYYVIFVVLTQRVSRWLFSGMQQFVVRRYISDVIIKFVPPACSFRLHIKTGSSTFLKMLN
jgi:hypothetical protein